MKYPWGKEKSTGRLKKEFMKDVIIEGSQSHGWTSGFGGVACNFLKTVSCYVAQAVLKLAILLPQHLE
jgi:hypothetical protein